MSQLFPPDGCFGPFAFLRCLSIGHDGQLRLYCFDHQVEQLAAGYLAFDAGEISVGAGRVIGAHRLSAARPVSRTIRACQRRVIRSHADCGSTTVAVAPNSVECANRAVDRLAHVASGHAVGVAHAA